MELTEKLQKMLDEIDALTVVELSQLVKGIEEKYGVSAVAAAAPAAGGAAAGPAVLAQHARRRPDQRGKAFAGLCLARIGAYPVRRGKACAVAPAAHG